MNWSLYRKVDNISGFDILEGLDGAEHAYAWRGSHELTRGVHGFANHLADVRILAKEFDGAMFGRGVLTGYFRGLYPPAEEVYRNVALGKYIYRSDAVDLLEYGALVRPVEYPFELMPFFRVKDLPLVLASSLEGLKPLVDEAIEAYPRKFRDYFP